MNNQTIEALARTSIKKTNRILLGALLIAWHCTASGTSNQVPTPISLAECLEKALLNNLGLQQEQRNPEISREDRVIARAGYDPMFQISARHRYEKKVNNSTNSDSLNDASETKTDSFQSSIVGIGPMGLKYEVGGTLSETTSPYGENAGGNAAVTLTQPLLKNFLINDVRYNTRISDNRLDSANIQFETTLQTLVNRVAAAYYELCYTRENIRVQNEGIALAKQLRDDNRRRVAIGAMTPLDENQAESQVAAREADLSNARLAFATAQNLLKSQIYSDYMSVQSTLLDPSDSLSDDPPVLNAQSSWARALKSRPELIKKRIDLESQGITVRYLKNRTLPELDLLGSVGLASSYADSFQNAFSDIGSGNEPFWSAGFQLSIPINNAAARAKLRQGKFLAEQYLLALKQQEQLVLIEVDEAIQRVGTRYDRIQSTRKARIYAEQSLDAEQKKMKSGNSTSFVVLQLQRDLTTARADEIRALVDYQISRVNLSRAEGDIMKYLNVLPGTKGMMEWWVNEGQGNP